jgi:hypothetical protein
VTSIDRKGIRRLAASVPSVLAIAFFMVACGGGAGALIPPRPTGCSQVVHGVDGVIRPQDSGLSCGEIQTLIHLAPSKPGAFLVESEADHRTWHCRLFDPHQSRILLSCDLNRRAFEIMKRSG